MEGETTLGRLKLLKHLYEEGFMSKEEFNARRIDLIDNLVQKASTGLNDAPTALEESSFRDSIASAVCRARDVIAGASLGENQPYDDQFALVESLATISLASLFNIFEGLGLTPHGLARLSEWARLGREITLRFRSEERCTFVRKMTRELKSETKMVREDLFGTQVQDKVVLNVTEFVWRLDWEYSLFAFAGSDESDRVTFRQRAAQREIVSRQEKHPMPAVVVRDPLDVSLSCAFMYIKAKRDVEIILFFQC
jgi:hypothetical protein